MIGTVTDLPVGLGEYWQHTVSSVRTNCDHSCLYRRSVVDLLDGGIILLALPDVHYCSWQCDTGSSDIE